MNRRHPSYRSALYMMRPQPLQAGFSLVTTLILLIVVTLLGVGASQMVLLSEKSTRFNRDQQIAFQAAEAALVDAEFDIRGPKLTGTLPVTPRFDIFTGKTDKNVEFIDGCGTSTSVGLCSNVPVLVNGSLKEVMYSVDFTDTSNNSKTVGFGQFTGRNFSTGSTGLRSEIAPRYIIELLPDPVSSSTQPRVLYRVTAMGFGPRKETQAVIQMVFRKE